MANISNLGGGRNFEQAIFRNLKIASVKSYERSTVIRFFIYEIIFSFFKNCLRTLIVVFFNFNASIFYNFTSLVVFGFLKFFLLINFLQFRKNFNYENLIIFDIIEILEEF